MKTALSFDDVLISPQFSNIKSRADVSTDVSFLGEKLKLGIISSNMDSVTGSFMADAMMSYGAQGALHRFQSIEDNVRMYKSAPGSLVSLGLGNEELERAAALFNAGANKFIIDVAHGANMEVVRQTKALRHIVANNAAIVVGNFATGESVKTFLYHLGSKNVQAIKTGIGPGSACTTRVVTGCGLPAFHSIIDCRDVGIPILSDGGIRSSGDFAKAIAAGATAVMVGGLLAGTNESPGKIIEGNTTWMLTSPKPDEFKYFKYKEYRGSASLESYKVQGKTANHRSPEGESFLVPYSGSVAKILQTLEGGLRSSMSYVGASTITEFQERAQFVQVTNAGVIENGPHGKRE